MSSPSSLHNRKVMKYKHEIENESRKYWLQHFEKIDFLQNTNIYLRDSQSIEDALEDMYNDVKQILSFTDERSLNVNEKCESHQRNDNDRCVDNEYELSHGTSIGCKRYLKLLADLKHPLDFRPPWRVNKSLIGLSLCEECDVKTKEIAKDFIKWYNGIGTKSGSITDSETILKLFDIGLDAEHYKCKNISLLTVYNKDRANLKIFIQKHIRIFNELKFMSKSANSTVKLIQENQHKIDNKIEMNETKSKIKSMQIIFEGIEESKCTQRLCEHLRDNPHILRPEYLTGKGLVKNN